MIKQYISMRKINLDRNFRKNIEKEYANRINSPSAMVFDFKHGQYPVFVMLTPQLHKLIVSIHNDSAFLANLQHHVLPGVAREWYIRKILIDEIKLTNDMENVHSTRREIKEALDSIDHPNHSQYVRFSGMARKYSSLIQSTSDVLKTCSDVRKLYDEFVEYEVTAENNNDRVDGQIFRKDHVYVQNNHGEIIHEGSYPESVIIENMEKALAILNDQETDNLIRMAVFHYLFGYIHPFYNGNGRLSRYISSMVLASELSALAGLRLSFVIKDHKRQYDSLFREANDLRGMGDLTDFVFSFLGYISKSIQDMINTLQSGEQTLRNIRQIIAKTEDFKKYERPIDILGQNGLFAEDAMSIDELQYHAKCGRATAQKAIDLAKSKDILTQTRQGHRYVYTILPDAWQELENNNSVEDQDNN